MINMPRKLMVVCCMLAGSVHANVSSDFKELLNRIVTSAQTNEIATVFLNDLITDIEIDLQRIESSSSVRLNFWKTLYYQLDEAIPKDGTPIYPYHMRSAWRIVEVQDLIFDWNTVEKLKAIFKDTDYATPLGFFGSIVDGGRQVGETIQDNPVPSMATLVITGLLAWKVKQSIFDPIATNPPIPASNPATGSANGAPVNPGNSGSGSSPAKKPKKKKKNTTSVSSPNAFFYGIGNQRKEATSDKVGTITVQKIPPQTEAECWLRAPESAKRFLNGEDQNNPLDSLLEDGRQVLLPGRRADLAMARGGLGSAYKAYTDNPDSYDNITTLSNVINSIRNRYLEVAYFENGGVKIPSCDLESLKVVMARRSDLAALLTNPQFGIIGVPQNLLALLEQNNNPEAVEAEIQAKILSRSRVNEATDERFNSIDYTGLELQAMRDKVLPCNQILDGDHRDLAYAIERFYNPVHAKDPLVLVAQIPRSEAATPALQREQGTLDGYHFVTLALTHEDPSDPQNCKKNILYLDSSNFNPQSGIARETINNTVYLVDLLKDVKVDIEVQADIKVQDNDEIVLSLVVNEE